MAVSRDKKKVDVMAGPRVKKKVAVLVDEKDEVMAAGKVDVMVGLMVDMSAVLMDEWMDVTKVGRMVGLKELS